MNESEIRAHNQRLGLRLFAAYLILYVGFMLLCALAPSIMESRPIAGLNLAILYGFGLIIAALIFALIYGFLCKSEPAQTSDESANGQGDKA